MKETLLDLFFPRNVQCFVCDKELFEHRFGLCEKCFSQMEVGLKNGCHYCGNPVGAREDICPACQSKDFYFTKGFSLFSSSNLGKKIVLRLKEKRQTYLADSLSAMLVTFYPDIFKKADCITYLPISRKLKKRQGFNPAELLATQVAKKLGCEVVALTRQVKKDCFFSDLTIKQRNTAIKRRFQWNESADYRKIVLINDVFATGAQLNECAKVIYERLMCDIIVVTLFSGCLDKQ